MPKKVKSEEEKKKKKIASPARPLFTPADANFSTIGGRSIRVGSKGKGQVSQIPATSQRLFQPSASTSDQLFTPSIRREATKEQQVSSKEGSLFDAFKASARGAIFGKEKKEKELTTEELRKTALGTRISTEKIAVSTREQLLEASVHEWQRLSYEQGVRTSAFPTLGERAARQSFADPADRKLGALEQGVAAFKSSLTDSVGSIFRAAGVPGATNITGDIGAQKKNLERIIEQIDPGKMDDLRHVESQLGVNVGAQTTGELAEILAEAVVSVGATNNALNKLPLFKKLALSSTAGVYLKSVLINAAEEVVANIGLLTTGKQDAKDAMLNIITSPDILFPYSSRTKRVVNAIGVDFLVSKAVGMTNEEATLNAGIGAVASFIDASTLKNDLRALDANILRQVDLRIRGKAEQIFAQAQELIDNGAPMKDVRKFWDSGKKEMEKFGADSIKDLKAQAKALETSDRITRTEGRPGIERPSKPTPPVKPAKAPVRRLTTPEVAKPRKPIQTPVTRAGAAVEPIKPKKVKKDVQIKNASESTGDALGNVEEILPKPAIKAATRRIFSKTGPTRTLFAKVTRGDFLKRYGTKGRAISDGVKKVEKLTATKAAATEVKMSKIVGKIDEIENKQIFDALQGRPVKNMSDSTSRKVAQLREILDEFIPRAQRANIQTVRTDPKTGRVTKSLVKPRKDFLPQVVKEDVLNSVKKDPKRAEAILTEFINKNVKPDGTKMSKDEAFATILTINEKKIGGTFGSFERARQYNLPDSMRETNISKLLVDYTQGAERKIAESEVFGADFSGYKKILREIDAQFGDSGKSAAIVHEHFRSLMGRKTPTEDLFEGLAAIDAAYNGLTKLGIFTAIRNVGDITKAFVMTNFSSATRAILQGMFTKTGKLQIQRSGITESQLRKALVDSGIEHGEGMLDEMVDAYMGLTGFKKSEKFVRGTIALANINYAESLVKSLHQRRPGSSLNIDSFRQRRLLNLFDNDKAAMDAAIKRGRLTSAEKDMIGYVGVRETQPLGSQSTPILWRRGAGKIASRYKSFAFAQVKFLGKYVVQEAGRGNIKPAIMFLAFSQIFGEPINDIATWLRQDAYNDIKDLAKGDTTPKEILKNMVVDNRSDKILVRMANNILTVGGLGVLTDFVMSTRYNFISPVTAYLAGPTLSDMEFLWKASSEAISGDTKKLKKTLGKKVLKNTPFFGPSIGQLIRKPLQEKFPKLFGEPRDFPETTVPGLDKILRNFGKEPHVESKEAAALRSDIKDRIGDVKKIREDLKKEIDVSALKKELRESIGR